MPLTQLSNTLEGTIPRERQLLKNIIYLGAVAQLLSMELETIEGLIAEQFKGKEKLDPAELPR